MAHTQTVIERRIDVYESVDLLEAGRTSQIVIDLRKLAAVDLAFLGAKFVVAEYTFGVFFSIALGVFVLFRSHSYWQVALGIYFVCLGINYAPMLCWAMAIGTKENAKAALGGELTDERQAMSKYRRQSVVLLIPLMPLVLMATQRQSRMRGASK